MSTEWAWVSEWDGMVLGWDGMEWSGRDGNGGGVVRAFAFVSSPADASSLLAVCC